LYSGSAWLQERSRTVFVFSLMLLVAPSASSCRSKTHCVADPLVPHGCGCHLASVFSSSSVASSGIGVPLMLGYAVRVVLPIQDTCCCRSACTALIWLTPRISFFPLGLSLVVTAGSLVVWWVCMLPLVFLLFQLRLLYAELERGHLGLCVADLFYLLTPTLAWRTLCPLVLSRP